MSANRDDFEQKLRDRAAAFCATRVPDVSHIDAGKTRRRTCERRCWRAGTEDQGRIERGLCTKQPPKGYPALTLSLTFTGRKRAAYAANPVQARSPKDSPSGSAMARGRIRLRRIQTPLTPQYDAYRRR